MSHVLEIGVNFFAWVLALQVVDPWLHELHAETEDESLECLPHLFLNLACLLENVLELAPKPFLRLFDSLELLPGHLPLGQHLFQLHGGAGLPLDQGSDLRLRHGSESNLHQNEVFLLDSLFELADDLPPFLPFLLHHLIAPSLELLRLQNGGHGAIQILDQRVHILAEGNSLAGGQTKDDGPVVVFEVVHVTLVVGNA